MILFLFPQVGVRTEPWCPGSTVITFPPIHTPSFPSASSLSTFPLPCSLSPPPLLSFASTFLDIRSRQRHSAYSFYSAVHIPLPLRRFFTPLTLTGLCYPAIPCVPTPPSAWLLTGAYFTAAHIRQPDEGNSVTVFIFLEEQSLTRAHCVCVCMCPFPSFSLKN